jgi:hypothetical protein
MEIDDKVNELFSEWKAHCETRDVLISSRPQIIIECAPYEELRKMGEGIFPQVYAYLKGVADSELSPSASDHALAEGMKLLVKDIAGDKMRFFKQYDGKIALQQAYVLGWLQGYLGK